MAVEVFELNNGESVYPGSTVYFQGGYYSVEDYNGGIFPFSTRPPSFIPYSSFYDQIPIAESLVTDNRPFYYLKFSDENRWSSMDDFIVDLENNYRNLQRLVTDLYWLVGDITTGGIAFGRTSATNLYCVFVDGWYSDGEYIHIGQNSNSLSYIAREVTIDNSAMISGNDLIGGIAPPSGTYSQGITFYNCYRYDGANEVVRYQGFGFNVNSTFTARAGYDIDGVQARLTFRTTGEFLAREWAYNYTDDLPGTIAYAFNKARGYQFMMSGSQPISYTFFTMDNYLEGTSLLGGEPTEYEFDNPYESGGSGAGGGFGNQNRYSQDTLPEGIPDLDLLNSGFVKLYNPTKQQLSDFASFLFSSITEDIAATFKRMIANPLDYIISLHMMHIPLHSSQTSEIGFCGISSEVLANEVDKQYYEIEYQLQIKEFWNSALDYTSYTKCKIYIPYCGIYDINIDEFQNGTMWLRYTIDCVSGACIAFLGTKRLQKDGQTYLRATLYQFNGNCILSMPVSSTNWQGVFQSIMGIASAAIAPGVATAVGMAKDIMGQKVSVQKSGSLSANYGYLGKQTPYVIIERPELSMPKTYGKQLGFPTNISKKLSDVKGYTEIDPDSIRIDGFPGISEDEMQLLRSVCSNGIVL